MKKNTTIAITFAIITVITVFCTLCAAAPVNSYVYKTVLPDTPLYAETSSESEILIKIPQNAVVEIVGEKILTGETKWQKVKYTAFTGYVRNDAVYRSVANDNYMVTPVTVVSEKMGEDIGLYDTHTSDAVAVKTVHDGEKVRLISNGIDYGDYALIEYEGDFYFIRSSDITDGLSYNQKLAVIIAGCFVGALILVGIITIAVRKNKKV
ncbi:MAG: hypothetical protein SO386_06305 [Eubacteriales bacterium]|nr:hypothetical protein [Eubacteriales bacterium]